MTDTMSPKLLEVRERAKRDPHKRFMSLAHLIDEATLQRAYDGIRKDAATGVDGITILDGEEYSEPEGGTVQGSRFGLRLHPDKTRLLSFARPQSGQTSGKGPATFDFLGFTIYWGEPDVGDGCRRTRRARRACDGPSRPSPTGADAIGICRSSSSTPRSCDASMGTATTLA